jgi:pimeloyl-ACP methyl ester carboxylesterase
MALPAPGPINWERVYAQARASKAAANRACAAASTNKAIIDHMGTVAVVRDLDALRAAVGDAKLTYWAMSYGTRIGYTYALRYPDKVRAIVLDGSIDPNGSIAGLAQSEVSGDTALGFLFQLYPEAQAQYKAVRTELDRRVISLPSGRQVTRWNLTALLGEYAGGESSYSALAQVIGFAHTALFGSGAAVASALAVLDGVPFDQSIGLGSAEFAVVNCSDYVQRPGVVEQNALATSMRRQAPVLGWLNAFADMSMCSGLRVPVEAVPVDVGQSAVPVLILGSTRDAHTPYAWTVSMTRAFTASRGVTYVRGKHVVYAAAQSSCVDAAGSAYLLTGTLPEFDVACQAMAPTFP